MNDFEVLYRLHRDAVFRFAVRCIGRRDLAEELTGDAFVALYRHLDTIDSSQLPSWLFTTVRNRAIDHWRRTAIEQEYRRDCREPQAVEPRGFLEAWIAAHPALKPAHRVCLLLRYVHGCSRAEIAEQTGLTANQVKGYLQYALEILRKDYVQSGSPAPGRTIEQAGE
jgi:RNA polymerase sigma-70 factor, ECF subfamily